MRFLADENFHGDILDGLRRVHPYIDVIRAQDTEVYQKADPLILAFAAQDNRILLTHDIKTMPNYAYERIAGGLSMPGVILVPDKVSIGKAIDDILTIIGASDPEEWEGMVKRLPL